MEELLTPKEAAKFLKIHKVTLYRLVKEGKIPAIKIGKQLRFSKEKLLRLHFNREK